MIKNVDRLKIFTTIRTNVKICAKKLNPNKKIKLKINNYTKKENHKSQFILF